MSIEPVVLERKNFAYHTYVDVPVDLSKVFLSDTSFVIVRVRVQRNPGSPESTLMDGANAYWARGLFRHFKPPAHPTGTITFVPPTPGLYTVVLDAQTLLPDGTFEVGQWRTEPITVAP